MYAKLQIPLILISTQSVMEAAIDNLFITPIETSYITPIAQKCNSVRDTYFSN